MPVVARVLAVAAVLAPAAALGAAQPPVDRAQIDRWMQSASNWGRWGPNDELGTLNLITPEKRMAAMALAKKGEVVSMAIPVRAAPKHPDIARDGLPNGTAYYEIRARTFGPDDPNSNAGYTSDIQEYAVHGGATHLDALCHMSDGKGRLYNGYPLTEAVSQNAGCLKLSLDKLTEGIVTRGLLVDMTRLRGRTRTAGDAVTVEDLEAWERQTGLRVSPGDALFVYDPATPRNGGFHISTLPWMKDRGVALTGGFSRTPPVVGELRADHRLALAGIGIHLLDGADLAPLSRVAARENRWEFMLVIAPPKAPGSSGAFVNPLAMF